MSTCVIQHADAPAMYWRRGHGWTNAMNATEFELSQMEWMPLPPHGEWHILEQPTIPRKDIA